MNDGKAAQYRDGVKPYSVARGFLGVRHRVSGAHMRVIVPTFQVACRLKTDIVGHKAGSIVTLAYGVALQGYAMGVVSSILAGAAAHTEALEYIAKYGADSWFPKPLQTIGIVTAAINNADPSMPPAPSTVH